MNVETIITLAVAGVGLIATIIGWVSEIRKGKLKEFVIAKMEEAEATGKTGEEKLKYVVDAVSQKYKVISFITNTKKFIEQLIDFSKKVNK